MTYYFKYIPGLIAFTHCFLFVQPYFTFCQTDLLNDSFNIKLKNGKEITLLLDYDQSNTPQYFYSDIFTQVCETGECKPVTIVLFWDLLGNYTHYEMPENAILTKQNHVPFTKEDYGKFSRVMSDRYSVLEDLDMDELTGKKEDASIAQIDGITGATPKSIADAIVEGAVYTCYTLWHLAHGEIKDKLLEISESKLSAKEALLSLMQSRNPDYRRWAIAKILTNHLLYPGLVHNLLDHIDPNNNFEIKLILKTIPESILKESWSQKRLWALYPFLKYELQINLLERFQMIKIDINLRDEILQFKTKANFAQDQLFAGLIFSNPSSAR